MKDRYQITRAPGGFRVFDTHLRQAIGAVYKRRDMCFEDAWEKNNRVFK